MTLDLSFLEHCCYARLSLGTVAGVKLRKRRFKRSKTGVRTEGILPVPQLYSRGCSDDGIYSGLTAVVPKTSTETR